MKSAIELYVSKIKEYQLAHKGSLRYLADCMNASHTFIKNIEDLESDKAYNLDHINLLAKVFECKISDLLQPIPSTKCKNIVT